MNVKIAKLNSKAEVREITDDLKEAIDLYNKGDWVPPKQERSTISEEDKGENFEGLYDIHTSDEDSG